MKEKLITILQKYSQEEWNTFIRAILFKQKTDININFLGQDLVTKIMNLYRIVNEKDKLLLKYLFDSCGYNLRTITKIETNSEQIYILIYLVYSTVPFEIKTDINKIIRLGTLKDMSFFDDDLEHMLLKAYIQMEDSKNPILKDIFINKERRGYEIYLRLNYFSHISDNISFNDDIKYLLESANSFTNIDVNVLFNSLIDIYPLQKNIVSLVYLLHERKIEINNNSILIEAFEKAIYNWKRETSNTQIISLILHIEDYINKNDINYKNNTSIMFENIHKFNSDIANKVNKYYQDSNYNTRVYTSDEELFNDIIATAV